MRTVSEEDRLDGLREDYADPRNVGLVDAVMDGFFNSATGEWFPGFAFSSNDVVVDVGAGGGATSMFAARMGASVIFTDVCHEGIVAISDKMRMAGHVNCMGVVSDSMPLPIKSGAATRVVMTEVLEHVEDPQSVLHELARIGTSGALYFLTVPHHLSEKAQAGLAQPYYFRHPNHIHVFEAGQVENMLSEAGLEIVNHSKYSFFWSFWMMIYWGWADAAGVQHQGLAHDLAQPPYPKLLNDWARLWHQIIKLPAGNLIRKKMNDVFPRSQIFVARKP